MTLKKKKQAQGKSIFGFSQALDTDGSGTIELEEFMSLMEERAVIPDWNEDDEEKLFIKAFETLDPNNTGKIPAHELR